MADNKYVVDHTSTYEHFLHVLSLGKDRHGNFIDPAVFDQNTPVKKLSQLWREIQEEDVTLRLNRKTGRVERHARGIRIVIHELRKGIVWREYARVYPGGKTIPQQKKSTASETAKRTKTYLQNAFRCLVEEMTELWEKFKILPTKKMLFRRGKKPVRERHESSVYFGLVSVVKAVWYDVYLDVSSAEHSLGDTVAYLKDRDGRKEPEVSIPPISDEPVGDAVRILLVAKPDVLPLIQR